MAESIVGSQTGTESSLSNWAGPYVTTMLGKGAALANEPYYSYQGPLSAGASGGQQSAFQGIANLAVPTQQMGAFTPQSFTSQGTAQQYMNPYVQAAIDPQIAEASRQAQIARIADAGRLTQAGAYGGSRQAIMESENVRNMLQNMAGITGTGYAQAYDKGQQQFNVEQDRARSAQDATNVYGLAALAKQAELGGVERGIEQEGMSADRLQFEEERDFPYKQVQYMQSLLQGLPIAAQSYSYAQPSALSDFLAGSGGIYDLLGPIFSPKKKETGLFDGAVDAVTGAATDAYNYVTGAGTDAYNYVTGAGTDAYNYVTGAGTDAYNYVTGNDGNGG